MFYHNINPVLLNLGPFEIRYYGIIYALAFVLAYFFISRIAEKKGLGLKKDDILDLLFYLLLGTIIGARTFEILVYNLSYYLKNPLEMIAIWHGGLSFHGGLIGASIAGYMYCRKKKIAFYDLADIVVIPLAFGLFLGRIANFINGELVGRIASVPWCVKFRDYAGCRHPSQLYESLKNMLIFSLLWPLRYKRLKKGTLFWSFILLYSALRFFVEFFRAPDPQLGFILGITMGQWLSIITCIIGFFFFIRINYAGYGHKQVKQG
ncbi:prolipoprotein diacylglyceryl transferase [Candidatus Woesearchaeota archaeon]|nr:prolipoprotein diacylglyceryl transferase [Candidatus Woesearchaeota archaeon]